MFSTYKSMIGSPCACDLFVSKVTKITRYMDVCFWLSFFGAFSVCDDCILKSTTAWLLKLSVLYIHSFIQVHNTTFQIKTVFNNVLFSTEVHNPLYAHLLALSHIYIHISLPGGRFKKEVIIDGQSYLLLIRDEGGAPQMQVSSCPLCNLKST